MSHADRPQSRALALPIVAGLLLACQQPGPTSSASGAATADAPAAGKGRLVMLPGAPPEGEWPAAARDPGNVRFSPLADITTQNVSKLKLAWSYDTGIKKGQEAAPLVVGGSMYVVTAFPNRVIAFDLATPGKPKWIYDPHPEPASQGVACCDVVNRGAAFHDGRLYFATLDAHAVAVDAATGKELWKTKLGEIQRGETMTMAPIVAKGKVLFGNSGGELGVRGWLTAVDEQTGKIAWRAYSTGPDADVLIGPGFRPHYPQDRGKDLGVTTWPPEKWKIGGGTVWGWVSYDPELDLVYYGTANPGPWNPEQRPGDNKWTAGVFARRPETGEAVWFYQWSPHDAYDHDGVNENVLLDLEQDGKRARKLLLHPDRNGYVYVVDRETGEVLSADPYAYNTISHGVDLKTGKLRSIEEKKPGYGRVVRGICPPSPGAKDWSPSSFSPRTGLLYLPGQNLCQDTQGYEASYIAGTPYVGANVRMYAGPGGNRGVLQGWDPLARKAVWKVTEKFPVWSGTVVTAGDVLFYGTMDGAFKAVDAKTGAPLWSFPTDSGVIGQPVTYRGPDGKQYVAVLSGVGGWSGAIVSLGLDPRDTSAALGFVNAMKDLPQATQPGGTLYVFALP